MIHRVGDGKQRVMDLPRPPVVLGLARLDHVDQKRTNVTQPRGLDMQKPLLSSPSWPSSLIAGVLFHALWWTHYVTFCALAVVYVWEILRSSPPSNGANRPSGPCGADLARLIDVAERCRGHLASSTPGNSPSRWYSIILEELRSEAKSQSSRRDAQQPQSGAQPEEDASGAAITCLFVGDTSAEKMNNLLAGWQMNDWVDLDSSAFAPLANWDMEESPVTWTLDVG